MLLLVQKLVEYFSKQLKKYGIKVNESAGDNQPTHEQIMEVQIVHPKKIGCNH